MKEKGTKDSVSEALCYMHHAFYLYGIPQRDFEYTFRPYKLRWPPDKQVRVLPFKSATIRLTAEV